MSQPKKSTLVVRGASDNPLFNPVEFDGIKKESGLNSFILTAKRWIESIGVAGNAKRLK